MQILLTVKYEYIPTGFSNSNLYFHFSLANQNFVMNFQFGLELVSKPTCNFCSACSPVTALSKTQLTLKYRGVDKSLAGPTFRYTLFDSENISFDASLVIYKNSTNIPPIMIINRIYETQNLLLL